MVGAVRFDLGLLYASSLSTIDRGALSEYNDRNASDCGHKTIKRLLSSSKMYIGGAETRQRQGPCTTTKTCKSCYYGSQNPS